MPIIWFFLMLTISISVTVAIYECWLMTHHKVGWGQPLPQDTFWGRTPFQKFPWNLVDLRLLTIYHFLMFWIFVPTVLLSVTWLCRSQLTPTLNTPLAYILFAAAGVLGVSVMEDALFFLISSLVGAPYPDALPRLLRGEANWHPRWINFGLFKLPDYYLWLPPLCALLLWVATALR